MTNCTFADEFPFVVLMPNSGLPAKWSSPTFRDIVRLIDGLIVPNYNVDPDRIMV